MLILSRKIGERVCIGASVVVTVVAARNGKVRLAFDAPAPGGHRPGRSPQALQPVDPHEAGADRRLLQGGGLDLESIRKRGQTPSLFRIGFK